MKISKILLISAILFGNGCATKYPPKDPTDLAFPTVNATSLSSKKWSLPKDLDGKNTLILIGYKQNSQFDIDRWLLGADQIGMQVNVLEIPVIDGWLAKQASSRINEGMRRGIPSKLWTIVLTVYEGADKIVSFTGNKNPSNARVMLLDSQGIVKYFDDSGYSVDSLKNMNAILRNLKGGKK